MVAGKVDATVITTDVDEILQDPDTDGVIISSTHPEHYRHICSAIESGKAIYVEKPMVTLLSHFKEVIGLMERSPVLFTLGLNRRYSPAVTEFRATLERSVDAVTYLVSQPYIPLDHWTLDEVEGGGRLIAEGEHFIDLCHFLVRRSPIAIYARALGTPPDDLRKLSSFAITIHYEGAVGNVIFTESGAPGFPRERVIVSSPGQVAILDDFARLEVHGVRRTVHGTGRRKEMGYGQALTQFVAAIRGQPNSLLTWEEASVATMCMFAAQESIRTGEPVDLRQFREAVAGPTQG
jgi:polar amino acid transport system substrate-binding protein